MDKDSGLCKECPSAIFPAVIFLGCVCGISGIVLVFYLLIYHPPPALKRCTRTSVFAVVVHVRAAIEQGPAKFKVCHPWPASRLRSTCRCILARPAICNRAHGQEVIELVLKTTRFLGLAGGAELLPKSRFHPLRLQPQSTS